MTRHLRVVAAWARQRERVLLHQRPQSKARGGLWELPGGKVEAGETDVAALARECEEELGALPQVGARRAAVTHAYTDVTVRLVLYDVHFAPLPPEGRSLDGGLVRYFAPSEAVSLALCDADRALFRILHPEL